MRLERLENAESIKTLSTTEIIRKYGGWNEGHFVFRNNEHGNGWIDKMGFLRYPRVMNEMGRRLAELYADKKDHLDIVIGPSIIGTALALSTAAELDVPFTTTYRTKADNRIHFHRGFVPEEGTRAIFVDDFMFSGKDLMDNIEFIKMHGVELLGVSVIGQRKDLETDVPIKSLLRVPFIKTSAEDCTMCKSDQPITAENIRE